MPATYPRMLAYCWRCHRPATLATTFQPSTAFACPLLRSNRTQAQQQRAAFSSLPSDGTQEDGCTTNAEDGNQLSPLPEKHRVDVPLSQQRSLTCAVLGVPNVGKSSIINDIIGKKVSIVSPKVQTTRVRTRGVWMHQQTQVVFWDTPGIVSYQEGRRLRLSRSLLVDARNAAEEADMVLNVIDDRHVEALANAREKPSEERQAKRLIQLLQPLRVLSEQDQVVDEIKSHQVLIVNKSDKLANLNDALSTIQEAIQALNLQFADILPVSALTGNGLPALKEYLLSKSPLREWPYDVRDMTNQTVEDYVVECVREQLFYHLEQELPYVLKQRITSTEEQEDGTLRVHVDIIAKSPSQKLIVIGKKGSRIKQITDIAQAHLEEILDRPVQLLCNVTAASGQDKARLFA